MNSRFLQSILISLLLSVSLQSAYSAEFLVRDQTYTIDSEVEPWEGACKWFYDGAGPDNWLSPDDYYNGTFYFRYEIISQPTNRMCGAQFVIWQDWNYPIWKEQASGHVNLYGPGDIAYGSGSPASWWMHDDVPLDFSRPDDIYKLGIMVWSMDPFGQIAYYRAEDPEVNIYDEIWNDRGDWFPMTLRFTVVAVSAGSTFSGNWAYYMGGGEPGIQPAYSIDFINEETNENILTQHEYSYDNANWYDGAGSRLALSPSLTIFFRDKNDNSLTQTLNVPARPSVPSFGIDYSNEQTSGSVSSAYEYCCDESMEEAPVGTGIPVKLTPGINVYFRLMATASSFRSDLQTLVVPPRPAAPVYTINFSTESTTESIGTDTEYAGMLTMSGASPGTGIQLDLIPGQDVFFRKLPTASAFASDIQHLEVPERPAIPVFSIDYVTEITNEEVGPEVEYADNDDFLGATTGEYVQLALIPGQNVYFRKPATDSSFKSDTFLLVSPERPVLSSAASSPTQDNPIIIDLDFSYATSSLNTDQLIVHNAAIGTPSGEYSIPLVPISGGWVYIQVAANAVAEGNFASERFEIEYESIIDGLGSFRNNDFIVFPNPARDRIFFSYPDALQESFTIIVVDAMGNRVVEEDIISGVNSLELGDLNSGIYVIIFAENEKPAIRQKLVIGKE